VCAFENGHSQNEFKKTILILGLNNVFSGIVLIYRPILTKLCDSLWHLKVF